MNGMEMLYHILFVEKSTALWGIIGLGVVIAKEICGTCKVKDQCLNHALQNHISHGVWGGTSERQRRRIRKEQRLAIKTS